QERSELGFDQLTRDEIGAKLAFAFKDGQLRFREFAFNYLEVRGELFAQGIDPEELSLDMAACDLSETDLGWADLRGANLERADLRWANLRGAYLLEANFSKANLRGADLRGTNLREADFRGADLAGADF
ncbi:unnamed protein product, partial [marine sediment metagenome]